MKGIKVLVFTDELLFEMGGSGQWSLIKVFPRASIESLRMSSSPMVGNGPFEGRQGPVTELRHLRIQPSADPRDFGL